MREDVYRLVYGTGQRRQPLLDMGHNQDTNTGSENLLLS